MKTIGLIGGMSWRSSAEYYRIINEGVAKRLGEPHSAQCILASLNFGEIEALQRSGGWRELAERLSDAARALERAGADCVLICANTMHKVANDVQAAVKIPLLHIADATAGRIKAAGMRRVGLLGTRFTMDEPFYKGRLTAQHGLEVDVPDDAERRFVDEVIYKELVCGEVRGSSRERMRAIMRRMADSGSAGVILGCTELELLIKPEDSPVPLFDTTLIHAEAAVEFALR